MNLEGKLWGYNKKTLAIVAYTIIIIAVAFFAGSKYEKSKLKSMGLLKSGTTSSTSKTKKAATDATATASPENTNASANTNATNATGATKPNSANTNTNTTNTTNAVKTPAGK